MDGGTNKSSEFKRRPYMEKFLTLMRLQKCNQVLAMYGLKSNIIKILKSILNLTGSQCKEGKVNNKAPAQ